MSTRPSPRDDESPEAAKSRYRRKLKELGRPPTFVVDSGNGLQVLWRLQEPIEPGRFTDAEDASVTVTVALDGPRGTQNVDRILRLPGTTNLPNPKKRRAGRVHCQALLLQHNDVAYPLEAFPKKNEAARHEEHARYDERGGNPAPELEEVIRNGCYDRWKGNRSDALFFVVCECLRRGWPDQEIIDVILDRQNAISEHIYDQGDPQNYAERQVARARKRVAAGAVRLEDFVAYMPQHNYIFMPTGEPWPAASVDGRLPSVNVGNEKPMRPSAWLDIHAPVEQMTWAPGMPQLIKNQLVNIGGWIPRPGSTVFNLYKPPKLIPEEGDATPWLELARKLYGDEVDHIIQCLAHRVQRPQEKLNYALVLGGPQGIGKDTLLHPVKEAVGPWNFQEVSPQQVFGRFNGFLKSTVLRVSEARDLGDSDRVSFYEHMKTYTAAPPEVLRVDEKFIREYYISNVVSIIYTTNHRTTGIYLPEDHRRHFVVWTDVTKEEFSPDYWAALWNWYDSGGIERVAYYLSKVDLSGFNPNAPPPKTQAFWDIVNASRAPQDAELLDALDRLNWPDAITKEMIASVASDKFRDWLHDAKNARSFPLRLEDCGYVVVPMESSQKGLWRVNGRRQAIYAKRDLSLADRLGVAQGVERVVADPEVEARSFF